MQRIVLLSLVLVLGLSGCVKTKIVTAPPVTYPHSLFECPAPPSGKIVTQDDVAKFIVDLGGAYFLCRDKLKNVETMVNK